MGSRLTIGFVSRYPPVHCGVAEYTRMLAAGIRRVAPEAGIVVMSSFEAGREPYRDDSIGVSVIPSFERGSNDYSGVLDALSEMGGVDVLHVQHEYGIFGEGLGILEAIIEAREEGLARVVVVTMHTVNRTGPESSLEFQANLGSVDSVVVHSVLQEFELQAQGLEPRKIWRIPHGTLINPYLDYPREALASRLGIEMGSMEGLILATPGFIRRDKGLDVLAEAVSMVKSRITVIVAGEPVEGVDGLEAISDRLVILDRYLSGDEILMLASLADAIVLPYKDRPGKYSVSGILHLSMGSLKPLIGTRVPRLAELYQYAPRLTVPPRTPQLLARKIEWLIHNYDMAVTYSGSLFAYAARTQWHRVARRHLEMYRLLLEEGVAWEALGEAHHD